jgi:pimeloyl-ACP methyl ester carboxylesterase
MKKTLVLPDGESLAFIDMGAPKGPPVVLIHGYTDSARDWVPLLPYLSPQLRLILIDIRGHGRSGKPECCYARLDFAYDVKLLLDALGVARADLVGHSLGSLIAQTFAEYWPERTRRVVLISSTGVRLCSRDSQAQGSDRSGFAVHDCLVGLADAGRRRLHPAPAAGRCGHSLAGLARRPRSSAAREDFVRRSAEHAAAAQGADPVAVG